MGRRASGVKEVSSAFANAHNRFKELYNEVNTRYARHSEKQSAFSDAKDRAYMNAVSKYQNAKTDAEKTAAHETLQKMVNETKSRMPLHFLEGHI